jgi:hypothetical protein
LASVRSRLFGVFWRRWLREGSCFGAHVLAERPAAEPGVAADVGPE